MFRLFGKLLSPLVFKFLWLLAKNKIMTIDNLLKRGITEPPECQFCTEHEFVQHLFFYCVVATYMWNLVYHFSGLVTDDYLSLPSRWLDEKKFEMINSISGSVQEFCGAYG